jgi:hypothetical protein
MWFLPSWFRDLGTLCTNGLILPWKTVPSIFENTEKWQKKVNFGGSIGMDEVNFIESNFIEFILGPI